MHGFSPLVTQLIALALTEDLACGDATTAALFDGSEVATASLVAKAPLVLAGGPVFRAVFEAVAALPGAPRHTPTTVTFEVAEGTDVEPRTPLATLHGPTVTLLRAERVGLNLLQRMCGVATQARAYQRALGPNTRIADTRKTTPGLRELERYAVRIGGAYNHRYNLGGGVMLKENHIAAVGGIAKAIAKAKAHAPHPLRVEVEVRDLDELKQALDAGADIVMLDNMDLDTMRNAVEFTGGRAILEVSGGVTLERLPALGQLGVDVVSSGALTHSVIAADISMLFDGT